MRLLDRPFILLHKGTKFCECGYFLSVCPYAPPPLAYTRPSQPGLSPSQSARPQAKTARPQVHLARYGSEQTDGLTEGPIEG